MEMQPYGSQQESEGWLGKTERWAIIGTLVVVGMTSYHLITAEREILPASLGGLTLSEKFSGRAAQHMVNHLHGRAVAAPENSIGFYRGETGDATLYVSLYSTHQDARKTGENLAERIRKGNPIFSDYQELQVAHQPVVECRGLDQRHYFFAFESRLYWLAVDENLAQQTVEHLIAQLHRGGRSS